MRPDPHAIETRERGMPSGRFARVAPASAAARARGGFDARAGFAGTEHLPSGVLGEGPPPLQSRAALRPGAS
jgi:hypothetical protein